MQKFATITHHASRHTSLSINSGIIVNYNMSLLENSVGHVLYLCVRGKQANPVALRISELIDNY